MTCSLKLLVLLSIATIQAQEPRKRYPNNYAFILDESASASEDISCSLKSCFKRSAGTQEDLGPFWANRGKKDPKFLNSKLYTDEPHWVLVHKNGNENEPFYVTRGKKNFEKGYWIRLKGKRNTEQDNEGPFFANRGKRGNVH